MPRYRVRGVTSVVWDVEVETEDQGQAETQAWEEFEQGTLRTAVATIPTLHPALWEGESELLHTEVVEDEQA